MRRTLIALAAVSALFVAACGDDSDSSGDQSAGGTESNGAGGGGTGEGGGPSGDWSDFCDGYMRVADLALESADGEPVGDLESVTPPPEIASEWEELVNFALEADSGTQPSADQIQAASAVGQWAAANCTDGVPTAGVELPTP